MAAKKLITARVLVACVIADQSFEPNALVKGDAELLEPLIKVGELSSDKAAVDYCSKELEVEVVDLNATDEDAESENAENTDGKE
ncbi:hypothetical protein C7Y70_13215 [Pseudoalteromonas sp. KS88]|uniref:hypothetical protein n=1 Tax=Pseudoalteromonas sp. KS88 TaxID=2109918 RepID=UPI0010800603|nr:hypothetical protein [Pseudoalteromonas sp. KS88]TGE81361.1 hypothetical protein C7Y70_13215 [Pseudoalteromonas sp. KS88]